MKNRDNKKILLGISIMFFIITAINIVIGITNTKKENDVLTKVKELQNDLKTPNVNYDKAIEYIKEKNDYEKKVEYINQKYYEKKVQLQHSINRFCSALSYEVNGDNNDKTITQLKEPLHKFIQKDCIVNDIEPNYVLTDKPLYSITRKANTFLYNNLETSEPTVLAIIEYTDDEQGKEFTTFKFNYNKGEETYKIKSIKVIRQKEY